MKKTNGASNMQGEINGFKSFTLKENHMLSMFIALFINYSLHLL
uniref:Uncharacterized protein n=1 Tax=Nelumbo nucifera TaxID=4432 RepID=A0A822ZNS8_NELNU|nr:TPA_asm: hypothetical protein HUJ06_003411 [Nelumbo nucifera]